MKLYVATSWKNEFQPSLVRDLRSLGHEVYDFRNPAPGDRGFSWEEIDPAWQGWTAQEYIAALDTDPARRGFRFDFDAMRWADACVLVLPSGRSAHVEAGWMAGAGKRVWVLTADGEVPELMYKLFTGIVTSWEELVDALGPVEPPERPRWFADDDGAETISGAYEAETPEASAAAYFRDHLKFDEPGRVTAYRAPTTQEALEAAIDCAPDASYILESLGEVLWDQVGDACDGYPEDGHATEEAVLTDDIRRAVEKYLRATGQTGKSVPWTVVESIEFEHVPGGVVRKSDIRTGGES